jgi:hypothetical protein
MENPLYMELLVRKSSISMGNFGHRFFPKACLQRKVDLDFGLALSRFSTSL